MKKKWGPNRGKDDYRYGDLVPGQQRQAVPVLGVKKRFTPYEQEHAFMDETQFDDVEATHGYLQEAIDLGGGEWLLGFRIMDDPGYIEYHKLSDIQIAYCELDERTDMDEDEEEE